MTEDTRIPEYRRLEDPVELAAFRLRHRTMSLYIALAYLPFVIRNALLGHTQTAWIYGSCSVACVIIALVSRRIVGIKQQYYLGHLTLFVAGLCTLAGAMVTGHSQAVNGWTLCITPLYASYLLGKRSTIFWSVLALIATLLNHLIGDLAPITPEFVPLGWKVWTSQTAMLLVVAVFGTALRRGKDRQVALLAQRTTDLDAARAELDQSYKKLQNLEQTRQQFVEMLIHDMRSPLTGISGYARLLQNPTIGDRAETRGPQLDRIVSLSEDLVEMISNMLDLSRLEEGALTLHREKIDYDTLLLSVIDRFSLPSKARPELTSTLGLQLSCDPDLIRRVLDNLISNAPRYSPPDTVIKIHVAVREKTIVTQVIDQGAGIDPAEHAKIFERFGQIENTPTNQRSSGVGLAFCKLAVVTHNGAIGVKSKLKNGATFWFELPLEPSP